MQDVDKVEIAGRIISYRSHYSLEGTNEAFMVDGVLMVSPSIAKLLSKEKGAELIKLATYLPVVELTTDQWAGWLKELDS